MVPAQLGLSKTALAAVEQIYAPVEAHLVGVQDSLKNIVPPETQLLALSITHSLRSQGKMLRPLLSLLASGSTGTIGHAHIETATVAELIHVATLLHDDVLDESDMRRGKSTVRAEWGNKVSILSGDYLLAQASLKLSLLNQCRLVSIFAIVLANLCEGEVEQMYSSYSLSTSWDSYFKKSVCKTAALFAACCESAGVINQLPEPEIQQLRLFGEKFGIAFQIIDDLLDYTSSAEKLGKPVLDDLRNGILNAPILLALEAFDSGSAEYQRLTFLIEQLFDADLPTELLASHQQELLTILEEAQAIPKTQDLACRFAQEARDCLSFLPHSVYQQALFQLTHYAIDRTV